MKILHGSFVVVAGITVLLLGINTVSAVDLNIRDVVTIQSDCSESTKSCALKIGRKG